MLFTQQDTQDTQVHRYQKLVSMHIYSAYVHMYTDTYSISIHVNLFKFVLSS